MKPTYQILGNYIFGALDQKAIELARIVEISLDKTSTIEPEWFLNLTYLCKADERLRLARFNSCDDAEAEMLKLISNLTAQRAQAKLY